MHSSCRNRSRQIYKTKRRTGQLVGAVVFTPSMPDLSVSLGITPVKKHDGESVATVNVCDTYGIKNDQIAGGGFDGQYFHLKVDKYIQKKAQLR